MRNQSAEVLRRVEAGESFQVSNNGRPAAVIVPVTIDVLDDLISRGEARPALLGIEALATIDRSHTTGSSAEMIEDARGPW
jgi:antitoxin (DNA-binding transcriptional repressor) of toxin-antitoxin stability system